MEEAEVCRTGVGEVFYFGLDRPRADDVTHIAHTCATSP